MNNNENLNKSQENIPENNGDNNTKKKITPYKVIRIILIVILSAVCVYCVISLGKIMFDSIEAKRLSNEVMQGFDQITNPEDHTINTSPIAVPDTTESESNKEEETEAPEYSEYFRQCLEEIHKMQDKYEDFKGFIVIDEIGLKYPIAYREGDNEYYLKHVLNGHYNERGEIYMEGSNRPEDILSNKNLVLYGHNLADGTKFGSLIKFKDEEVFKNSIVKIITEEGIFSFKLFSFYKTDDENPYNRTMFEDKNDFLNFCNKEKQASRHKTDFEFTGDEVIITLSTCVSYFGGRWCTHGVLTDISQ